MTKEVNQMRQQMQQMVDSVKTKETVLQEQQDSFIINQIEEARRQQNFFQTKYAALYKKNLQSASSLFREEARVVAREVSLHISNITANYRKTMYKNFELT